MFAALFYSQRARQVGEAKIERVVEARDGNPGLQRGCHVRGGEKPVFEVSTTDFDTAFSAARLGALRNCGRDDKLVDSPSAVPQPRQSSSNVTGFLRDQTVELSPAPNRGPGSHSFPGDADNVSDQGVGGTPLIALTCAHGGSETSSEPPLRPRSQSEELQDWGAGTQLQHPRGFPCTAEGLPLGSSTSGRSESGEVCKPGYPVPGPAKRDHLGGVSPGSARTSSLSGSRLNDSPLAHTQRPLEASPAPLLAALTRSVVVRAKLATPFGTTLRGQIAEAQKLLDEIRRGDPNSLGINPSSLRNQRALWVSQLIDFVQGDTHPKGFIAEFLRLRRRGLVECQGVSSQHDNGVLSGQQRQAAPRKMLRCGEGARRMLERTRRVMEKQRGDSNASRGQKASDTRGGPSQPQPASKGNSRVATVQSSADRTHALGGSSRLSNVVQSTRTADRMGNDAAKGSGPASQKARLNAPTRSAARDVPQQFSSKQALRRTGEIDKALRKIVKGASTPAVLPGETRPSVTDIASQVTPNFLSERKNVFFRTLFSDSNAGSETKHLEGAADDRKFPAVPRLDAVEDRDVFFPSGEGAGKGSPFIVSGGYFSVREAISSLEMTNDAQ